MDGEIGNELVVERAAVPTPLEAKPPAPPVILASPRESLPPSAPTQIVLPKVAQFAKL